MIQHITDQFGDESFRAIDCTGTDNHKQRNKTIYAPETQKTNKKTTPANKTNPGWYAFYDLRPGNERAAGLYSYNPRTLKGEINTETYKIQLGLPQ